MAKKTINSELHFRCDATKKAKAKYLCQAKLGKSLSQVLRETVQSILTENHEKLSHRQREEMKNLI
jgi:hypothetical protein